MTPKEIYVSVKFTKNMGNYQSFVAEAGVTASLDNPDETPGQAFSHAWNMVREEVANQILIASARAGA